MNPNLGNVNISKLEERELSVSPPHGTDRPWCSEVAFKQKDVQEWVLKRSSLEQPYYVQAELPDLYANTKN